VARAVKRVLDTVASAVILLLLSPLILVLALLVRINMGSPVFFRQQRPGLSGAPFMLLKFRTMRPAETSENEIASDASRLTPLGAWMRRHSLDELPQLWNVLRGDMSLVGPRPLLMQYLARYTPEQARRHLVRPGITGWTQVRGRNALSWEQKFALDVWYVDHWSLGLDARILAETAWRVLKREGIARQGYATMPEFMGSKTAGNGK
jgi:lipopolysaccharide/colanic/teichoic acid biosynthesis glycosyltransferase